MCGFLLAILSEEAKELATTMESWTSGETFKKESWKSEDNMCREGKEAHWLSLWMFVGIISEENKGSQGEGTTVEVFQGLNKIGH